jgi:hypothetical protein
MQLEKYYLAPFLAWEFVEGPWRPKEIILMKKSLNERGFNQTVQNTKV